MKTALNSRRTAAILSTVLLVACDRGPEPDAVALTIDSAGVRIVEGDPSSSDATCTISEEPTLVIGDDETDERQWFSYIRGAADAAGSTIALAHGLETEVRVLDDEFNLRTIIRWHEPDREVTGADVRAWREDYYRMRGQPASVGWDRYDDARVSDNRPVADLFPAIYHVMIGRDGRIWVRQYDRPREDRAWLAFAPDGDFVCHLPQLPGSVREFGDDHVLLLSQSELGIQMLHLYSLHLPGDD